MNIIKSHRELEVYKLAFKSAMEIYSLTDQIRRSSRSVAANLAEGFRKRRYEKAFVAKLSDSEGEAAETQTWLDFALECQYITPEKRSQLNQEYEHVIGKLVNMIKSPEKWSI
jgi:four helix bundle protein